jgi:pimeloyl-ACP methyl ester carboxylesterase
VRLASGRQLAFRCYGPPGAAPVVYVHGFASSRLEPALAADLLPGFKVRIVAFDRPGYGGSDPLPSPGLRAAAESLLEGVSRLGLDRPALCGTSAGAPYALALAGLAPQRFGRLALLSGLAPDRLAAAGGAAAWLPRLARSPRLAAALLRTITAAAARPRVAAAMMRPLDLQLRRYVDDAELRRSVVRALRASLGQGIAQGARGVLDDVAALTCHWQLPRLPPGLPGLVLHGRQDWIVPVAHAERFRQAFAAAEMVITDDEHVSAVVNHRERILSWLA